jgi:hypothetical protein
MVQGNFSTIMKIQQALEREGAALSPNRGAGLACGWRRSRSEASFDFAKLSQN